MNPELVRKELDDLINEYPITLKYIAEIFTWDYTTLIKFRNGQETYGQARLKQLHKFILNYKNAIDSL